MSTNQDSRLDTAKSLLHREAEALLRFERQQPGTYPNNMIKLFDDIVIYSTNKSGQAKTTLDNINIAFISAVQALKKSHSVEKKAPISDDIFIMFA